MRADPADWMICRWKAAPQRRLRISARPKSERGILPVIVQYGSQPAAVWSAEAPGLTEMHPTMCSFDSRRLGRGRLIMKVGLHDRRATWWDHVHRRPRLTVFAMSSEC